MLIHHIERPCGPTMIPTLPLKTPWNFSSRCLAPFSSSKDFSWWVLHHLNHSQPTGKGLQPPCPWFRKSLPNPIQERGALPGTETGAKRGCKEHVRLIFDLDAYIYNVQLSLPSV